MGLGRGESLDVRGLWGPGRAHLALRGLRGGGVPAMLQQLLLQLILLLRGVEAVHGHELVA